MTTTGPCGRSTLYSSVKGSDLRTHFLGHHSRPRLGYRHNVLFFLLLLLLLLLKLLLELLQLFQLLLQQLSLELYFRSL